MAAKIALDSCSLLAFDELSLTSILAWLANLLASDLLRPFICVILFWAFRGVNTPFFHQKKKIVFPFFFFFLYVNFALCLWDIQLGGNHSKLKLHLSKRKVLLLHSEARGALLGMARKWWFSRVSRFTLLSHLMRTIVLTWGSIVSLRFFANALLKMDKMSAKYMKIIVLILVS